MSSRSTAKSPNNGTAPRDCLITFFETNPIDLNAVLPATVLLASRRALAVILALGIQLFFIFILIEDYGIISFPIAISAMFVSMALFILIEILSLIKSSNKVM